MKSSYRKEVGLLATVSLLFSLTFFVFGPIQLYLGNITELWFSMGDMIGGCLLGGAAAAVVIFLLGLILKGKALSYYICLIFGLSLALYIQGNFVTTNYGVLNGQAIDWDSYAFTAIWNTILWIVCILLPFVLRSLFKDKCRIGIFAVSVGILLVQTITFGTLCVMTDFSANQQKSYYLSNQGLYSVSDKENIVIFVLDTFDQVFFEEIQESDPDFLAPLDGFTYFQNMTGEYPTTKGALPYILTQQYYENEQPYADYIEEAYTNTDYYSELMNSGYDIALYTSDRFVSDSAIQEYLSNAGKNEVIVASKLDLEKEMLRFTAFRYFPHLLKRYVWLYSAVFDDLKTVPQGKASPIPLYVDNVGFYTNLKDKKLTCESTNKSYRLIHLEGTHQPANLTEDVTLIQDGKGTFLEKSKGVLNIVYEYIGQLKELDIYDRTLMIITADHGFYSGGETINNPILLVKDFDSRGELSVSDVPVSHTNLFATVMDEIGLNADGKYGTSVYHVKPDDDTKRRYLNYLWDSWDKEYLPDMTEYTVSPRGNEAADYLNTGYIYTSDGRIQNDYYTYHEGDVIRFTEETTGIRYFEFGISGIEKDFVWSYGKIGRMHLNFEEIPDDLTGEFKFHMVYDPPQRLVIRCGDQLLYDEDVTTADALVTFSIPSECVQNGSLILDLEYPNAVSPKSREGSDDARELAFAFSSVRFGPKLDNEQDKYRLGSEILFTEEGGGVNYFRSGISGVETDFAWSLGTKGKLCLDVGEVSGDLTGTFRFRNIHGGAQRLVVKSAGQVLYDQEVTSIEEAVTFTVPAACVQNGELILDLEYPEAFSPSSAGAGDDNRMLAFAFSSIRFARK